MRNCWDTKEASLGIIRAPLGIRSEETAAWRHEGPGSVHKRHLYHLRHDATEARLERKSPCHPRGRCTGFFGHDGAGITNVSCSGASRPAMM